MRGIDYIQAISIRLSFRIDINLGCDGLSSSAICGVGFILYLVSFVGFSDLGSLGMDAKGVFLSFLWSNGVEGSPWCN